MSAAIPLRDDYNDAQLQALARTSNDASGTRRLLSLAFIYKGWRRSEAAALGSVGLQIIRERALRFNAESPDGLIDRPSPALRPS